MQGKKRLTKKLKEALIELSDHTCENCHLSDHIIGKLQIHRIIRGINGGTYLPANCKILCKECHKMLHYREFK